MLHILIVFTFPTWTLARYALPTYLFLFMVAGVMFNYWSKVTCLLVFIFLFAVTLVANVTSADTLTKEKLQPLVVQGVAFYSKNVGYNGYTMVDYNIQYLQALKKQNTSLALFFASQNQSFYAVCSELKVGEKIVIMQLHPQYYPQFAISGSKKLCVD